jgi:hypothetical protein
MGRGPAKLEDGGAFVQKFRFIDSGITKNLNAAWQGGDAHACRWYGRAFDQADHPDAVASPLVIPPLYAERAPAPYYVPRDTGNHSEPHKTINNRDMVRKGGKISVPGQLP